MPTTTDTITTSDGTCPVTVATPEGDGPWPGVVLFPDAGGLRPTMEQMAAKLAGFGYVVLVPDVYYRTPGWGPFDLNTVFTDQEQRKQLFELMGTLTPEIIASDAEAFFDYLAARTDVTGEKFGTTGYCMGGRASLIVATRVPERVAAALSFHGGRLAVEDDPDSPHLLADKIQATVYVAAAENDASFTEDDSQEVGGCAVRRRRRPHHRVLPGGARLRGARSRGGVRRGGCKAALGEHGAGVRGRFGPGIGSKRRLSACMTSPSPTSPIPPNPDSGSIRYWPGAGCW